MNAPRQPEQSWLGAEERRGAAAVLAMVRKMERVRSANVDGLLDALARPRRPQIVAFVNAHAVNLAWDDAGFADALLRAHVLLRDGAGVAILCAILGLARGANLNGTDIIPRLVERFGGRRVALFGTREPWLAGAAGALRHQGVEIVATLDGFRGSEAYVELARATRPDLIVLGLGMPRQEFLAGALADALGHPCLIVAGGAIIDFWAGRFPRAPRWMRALGIEWTYRLWREPGRLWRRYLIGNPVFLVRALRLRWYAGSVGG